MPNTLFGSMFHASAFFAWQRAVACVLLCCIGGLLSGCLGSSTPDLSGVWEADEVGMLQLTQSGNTLSAEQKDSDFREAFGPKMFEGVIEDGVLRGKVATALPVSMKEICGKNWGSWSEIELRVAPDGLALEGKWLRATKQTSTRGCPVIETKWVPFRLIRGAGEAPVQLNTMPKWVPGLVVALGLLIGFGFRYALVRYLVGPLKRSPNTASAAGWALLTAFVLGGGAMAAPLWGASLASAIVWAPLAGLSLAALIATFILSLKH